MQPTKILSSLVDSNLNAIAASAIPSAPGSVVNIPSPTPPAATADLDADYNIMYQLAGSNVSVLNQFMGSYNKFGTGLPGNISDFATQYANYLVAQGLITQADVPSAVNLVLNGFATSFQAATSFSTDSTQESALATLFPNLATDGAGNAADDADQYQMANAMWSSFIGQFSYQQSGAIANSTTTPAQGFFQTLSSYLAVTATVSSGLTVDVNGSSGVVAATSAATPSFQALFYQYFPTPNPNPQFQADVTTFARNMIQQYGYFSPSIQYTKWVNFIQAASNTQAPATVTLPPTNVNVIENILSLIGSLIGIIQNMAASQASRLALYTSWERGYTDLQNQVPTFTGSSKDRLQESVSGDNYPLLGSEGASGTRVTTRNNEQANFNSSLTQQITAYSNTVQEDAKTLQSNISQTTDAFNNQATTASTMIQTVSTILSSIFR